MFVFLTIWLATCATSKPISQWQMKIKRSLLSPVTILRRFFVLFFFSTPNFIFVFFFCSCCYWYRLLLLSTYKLLFHNHINKFHCDFGLNLIYLLSLLNVVALSWKLKYTLNMNVWAHAFNRIKKKQILIKETQRKEIIKRLFKRL